MHEIIVNNNSNKNKQIIITVVAFILFIILLPRIMLLISKTTGRYRPLAKNTVSQNIIPVTPQPTGPVFPSVSGTGLIDQTGKPFLVHGAVIESALSDILRWKRNEDPTQTLSSQAFQTISSWHMNAVRIPISEWIYELDPTKYMNVLDQVVSNANTKGLYVILSFKDDKTSGSPYHDGMLHAESLQWWKIIAGHYKDNTQLMFDPVNEPQYPDWTTWLHGNTQTVRGFQDIVDAIRSVGSHQIIIVESGNTGSQKNPQDGGWETFNALDMLNDPNIVYSKHAYQSVISGDSTVWNKQWGILLNTHPILYGEWGVIPSATEDVCSGLTSDNASSKTTAFLQYMKNNNISWVAWDFEPGNLVQNLTDFTPTTFTTAKPWQCNSFTAKSAGMGETVKNFLAQ